ncbi:MAG: S-methyl-5-thioribose-1-phosphate isomerase [Candidatus Omnitrophota bacterium]|nr:S-methyl-5-thioribose-1-phosphate isomerase [Candidatus Omnitrophota bacterium]MDZ4241822.1 S-methyl-5-thioribose-1-phosphate isomerase [Candidatus Omnitrophota bacterium]
MSIQTITWINGAVRIIDQTLLPRKFRYLYCRDVKTLWHAIRRLQVRGAPAIGVAAGFGVLLGLRSFRGNERRRFLEDLDDLCHYIGSSRPTAVNLFNVLNDMKAVVHAHPEAPVPELKKLLHKKAMSIYEEDRRACRMMGRHGAKLIKSGMNLLTICNAGALATVDYGTAEGVMSAAKGAGKKFKVYACETRPLLQGARLTTWELMREKIDVTLICDSMAGTLMKQGEIDVVFTGADRIAANGDAANKIGTYSLAVLARHHKIPFYIVAPYSTFDLKISSGEHVPIEERDPAEVTRFAGVPTAPRGVKAYNPAFDVTDHELIHGIVTERGVIRPPYQRNIKKTFSG